MVCSQLPSSVRISSARSKQLLSRSPSRSQRRDEFKIREKNLVSSAIYSYSDRSSHSLTIKAQPTGTGGIERESIMKRQTNESVSRRRTTHKTRIRPGRSMRKIIKSRKCSCLPTPCCCAGALCCHLQLASRGLHTKHPLPVRAAAVGLFLHLRLSLRLSLRERQSRSSACPCLQREAGKKHKTLGLLRW